MQPSGLVWHSRRAHDGRMSGLDPYRAKRDAARTPEPVPEREFEWGRQVDHTGDEQVGRGDGFVVQEHHATALHWDVRLERDGVLVSWAVPKGFPLDPATNHLAKQTEDHPMEYAGFEGEIPKGEYGGGAVTVWDHGRYQLEKWRPGKVQFVLSGQRVSGRYIFFRTNERDWMLHRMDPRPEGWAPLPQDLAPMLPTTGRRLPRKPEPWAFEVDWGGFRVLVAAYGGRLTVSSDGANVLASFPELRALGLQLGSRQVLLDGELVLLDAAGRPDADLLRQRAGAAKPGARLLREAPVQLMVTDVLHAEGSSLLEAAYDDRRTVLEGLAVGGSHWQVPPSFPGAGQSVLDAAAQQGLPGVLAKRRTSPYRPGAVSDDWRAIPI